MKYKNFIYGPPYFDVFYFNSWEIIEALTFIV